MSSDGFENRLKQRLEDAEIAPPGELWGQIASNLEPQRRRKKFFFWFMLGIFLLLLIASALTIPHLFTPKEDDTQSWALSGIDSTHSVSQGSPDNRIASQSIPDNKRPLVNPNNRQESGTDRELSDSFTLKNISTEAYLPELGFKRSTFHPKSQYLTIQEEKSLGIIDSIYFTHQWNRHIDFPSPILNLKDPWSLSGKWSLAFWTGTSFGLEASFLSAMEADLSSYSPGEEEDAPDSEGSNTFPLVWQREYPRQSFYLGSNLAYQLNPKLSLQADLSLAMSQRGSQSLTSVDFRYQSPNLSDLPSQTQNREYRIWQLRSMIGLAYHSPVGYRSSWVNGFYIGSSYFMSTSIKAEEQLREALDPNLYSAPPKSGQLQRWEMLFSLRSQYHYRLDKSLTLFVGPYWEWNPGTRDNFNSVAKTSFNHQLGIQLGLKFNR